MSYEIVRDRRFISLGDGRYLPITLSGSSNCTMFYKGKEVLEREWGLMFFNLYNIKTADEMIQWAEDSVKNWHGKYSQEWFKWGGKWIVGKDIISWIKNGIKSAHTIEEYYNLAHTGVDCSIHLFNEAEHSWKTDNNIYCKTTAELLSFIEAYCNYNVPTNTQIYASIRFNGLEPLKMPTQVKDDIFEAFIVKDGKNYLQDYTENEMVSRGIDRSKAKVFHGKEEWEKIVKTYSIFHSVGTPKAISASSVSFTQEKNYYIVVEGGSYSGCCVKRLSSNALHFTYGSNNAIKFATESSAKKYVEKLMGRDFPNCKSFRIETLAK